MSIVATIVGGSIRFVKGLVGTFNSENRHDQRERWPIIREQYEIIERNVSAFENPTFFQRPDSLGNDPEHKLLSDKARTIKEASSKMRLVLPTEVNSQLYELHQRCLSVLNLHWNDRTPKDQLTQEQKDERNKITLLVVEQHFTVEKSIAKILRLK